MRSRAFSAEALTAASKLQYRVVPVGLVNARAGAVRDTAYFTALYAYGKLQMQSNVHALSDNLL
jgi:hypothetical protein